MTNSILRLLSAACLSGVVLSAPANAQHMMQSVGEEEFIVDADLLRSSRITPAAREPQVAGERVVMDAEATVEEIRASADEARVFFEPRGMIALIRERPDLVLLMRHGQTDWSFLDAFDVEPEDCARQRIMTVQGREDMRALGHEFAEAGLIPSQIVSSRWCRNQDTTRNFMAGMAAHPNSERRETVLEWDNDINLLLSTNGAQNVTPLRTRIAAWNARQDGETDEAPLPGPLLIVSHFTNIAELTEFNVYEGEMLVLDPDRNNRVLGYLRLADAAPDIGHFDPSVTGVAEGEAVAGEGAPVASSTESMPTADPEEGLEVAGTNETPMAVTVVGRKGSDILLTDEAGRELRMSKDELDAFLTAYEADPKAVDDDDTISN